ncbi:xanthine dehydrogenase family protein molybdopterin-binding subunit [Paralimibaculum aggregatum]|uniref:Xanthine dehydrogenase family protein molybdopterin-binding subunit n=1 Tax=Paralimibaculum aggregatum TaxID=3036245 RepID=A0ABQ6LFB7_9RHOB|nr:xanthine dehydrogenase family protein molybdopterin-binding subunit [Limibaculum sp. NKW23]GMG81687.1 xanthine dehydrogenase family protein molybdopterin-binding subunit [Limibaculum sp. NKW23]
MSKFGLSQPVRRVEDLRFLTGAGRYVDDIAPAGALHAVFVRSPVAHAVIAGLDIAEAAAMPGVRLVMSAAELEETVRNDMPGGRIPNRDGSVSVRPKRPMLARERVRHVGEAVAVVVAGTLAEAHDAAEAVTVDYDSLPAVTDAAAALAGDGAPLHEKAPGNLCYDWGIGDEAATDAALAAAAHRVTLDLVNNRVVANPLETRACIAEWADDHLTLTFNGQGVWDLRDHAARALGLDRAQVTVRTPDVGGGFGMKAFIHPEYVVCAEAARRLGTPVKWTADRSEGFLADVGGRDQRAELVAGFDAYHRLVAMKVRTVANLGAYCSQAGVFIASQLASRVLTGVYDLQTAFFGVRGAFTNTTPVDAYRGAGRPEAQYQLERLIDKSARVLGVDPVALRRKNFIRPEQFPYRTIVDETYDVGDFGRVLDRALAEADHAGFAARRAASEAAGKYRGLGLCCYIESILGAPDEIARIAFAEDGGVDLYVGTQSNGQGHETVYRQFLHARTGIPFEKIRVVQGDTSLIAKGGGTGGSRSVTTQGTAINGASDALIEKLKPLAEAELEVSGGDLVWEAGAWRVAGTDRAVDLMRLAARGRAEGRHDLLTQETGTELPGRSFPNGCHIAEVEIDPETGVTACVKYTVVDDFGVLMNPMLAEGQVHGGVVQGIGQALAEHVVFDEDGQLLSATFMDYALPRAADVPWMPFHHEGTPSTANAIGMKGCGEAGTVGALAAVMNACLDALWDRGVRQVDMPMTPARVWSMLNAQAEAAG